MKRSTRLAAYGVAGALLVGGAVPAIAQIGEGRGAASEQREAARAEHRAEFAERLAAELGLDADTVADALDAVREQLQAEHRAERLADLEARLDERVADGDLTREQADAILDAAESGVLPFGRDGMRGPRGHHGPRGGFPGASGDLDEAEA